jgi:nucleoside-diphosphate-sugar epimerase
MRNMKIIVTGGAGFLGSHLVDRLFALGYEVAIIDNLWQSAQKRYVPEGVQLVQFSGPGVELQSPLSQDAYHPLILAW